MPLALLRNGPVVRREYLLSKTSARLGVFFYISDPVFVNYHPISSTLHLQRFKKQPKTQLCCLVIFFTAIFVLPSTYPFSLNHGSVENYPERNRSSIIILKIHPFSTKETMSICRVIWKNLPTTKIVEDCGFPLNHMFLFPTNLVIGLVESFTNKNHPRQHPAISPPLGPQCDLFLGGFLRTPGSTALVVAHGEQTRWGVVCWHWKVQCLNQLLRSC